MLKVGMLGMGGISRSHYTSWKQIPEAELVCLYFDLYSLQNFSL